MPDIQLRQQVVQLAAAKDRAEVDIWLREQFPASPGVSVYPTRRGINSRVAASYTLTADAGALVFGADSATLTYTPSGGGTPYTLTADPGALTFSAISAALNVGRVLAANPGALTLTGANATYTRAITLAADPGALTLTGSVATFPGQAVETTTVAGGKGRRRFVEIDGELFPVRDAAEAAILLRQAREIAREVVAARPKKAKLPAPKIALVKPDYSDEITQHIQAQIDATVAQITRIYRREPVPELDDDEVAMLLLTGML